MKKRLLLLAIVPAMFLLIAGYWRLREELFQPANDADNWTAVGHHFAFLAFLQLAGYSFLIALVIFFASWFARRRAQLSR